jgi:hypothetical protein
MPIDENLTAHHEAGHAVLAYEAIGPGATESLSIVPGSDYLGVHVRSDAFQAKVQELTEFVDGGVVRLMDMAEAEGDYTTYAGWDDDKMDAETERLNHRCDLVVDFCIAGHIAEEVFREIPNDTHRDDDWEVALNWAAKLHRCETVYDFEGRGDTDCTRYFDSRWKAVSELLDGKYRQAVEVLVERLLEKKTISGAKVTRIITASLLPELADRADNSYDWNASSFL